MLKHNRPYTNENGSVDDKLVTDRPSHELKVISNWIKKNIVPGDAPYEGNSYSLKHRLERDTGLYMTNNEFKDAMLLTGFLPVDPDALNWKYNIIYIPEINMIPFESLWKKFTKYNHEGCCHCCKNHTCNVNLKKTTYTTTRYDVGDGFYVEVSPNEKEESVEFYLGHNRYGVKELIFDMMEKDCPKDDEKIQFMILQNVEDGIKIYKEEYFDGED